MRRVVFRNPTSDKFNIADYVKNLPSGMSIGQAIRTVPKYKSELLHSLESEREAWLAEEKVDKVVPTAAKCEMYLNDQPITVIIDSGAATSIITNKLMKSTNIRSISPLTSSS